MSTKREIRIFIILVSIFYAFHFIFWNASQILALLDNQVEKNIVYELQDFEMEDYFQTGNDYTTGKDPKLIGYDVDKMVKNLLIDVETEPQISYVQIFYTNNEVIYFGEKNLLEENKNNQFDFLLKDSVKDLRIDLGDTENVKLKNIKVTINPVQLNFSLPILIVIIIICAGFKSLGLLQRQYKYDI